MKCKNQYFAYYQKGERKLIEYHLTYLETIVKKVAFLFS